MALRLPATGLAAAWARAMRVARFVVGTPESQLREYVVDAPHPQHAVDIFEGDWIGRLPPPADSLRAGELALYDDARLRWGIEQLPVPDGRILELGPLEGSHSYMLQQAGAREVVAVEASTRAYLRCLMVKDLAGLDRVRFLCGDFVEYLRTGPGPFDVAVASGVLYHLANPVELLFRLADAAGSLYIWTHYFDEQIVASSPRLAGRFGPSNEAEVNGFGHRLHPFRYASGPVRASFCGGTRRSANWLTRDDLIAACRAAGFTGLTIGPEERDHPNGPCLALVARRA